MIFTSNDIPLDELYEEVPVDIDTFVDDDKYFGYNLAQGKKLYPFWRKQLKKIFSQDKMVFIDTGIGVGRTLFTTVAMAYYLYNLMCLRNPQKYFKFINEDTISIGFFNANSKQAKYSYDVFVGNLSRSPWFVEHGTFNFEKDVIGNESSTVREYVPNKNIIITCFSSVNQIYGRQLLCSNISTDNRESHKALDYNPIMCIRERVLSRATIDGRNQGLVIWEHRNTPWYNISVDKLNAYVIKGSHWNIKPADWYSWEENNVVIVNPTVGKSRLFKSGEIVNDGEYLLPIPDDFVQCAVLDTDSFLIDMAGIQLSVLERHVPFKQAYEKLLTGNYFIEYCRDVSYNAPKEEYDYHHRIYYVKRGVIYSFDNGYTPKAELWDVKELTQFMNCDDWTVGPVEYYDLT